MDKKDFQDPNKLERWSFLWSQVRLLIASVALLLGGVPPIFFILRMASFSGLVFLILKICWIVSGLASFYLLYRWYKGGQNVFGGKNQKDLIAFGVSVVSGLNLGLTGILGTNIGMSIASSRPIFAIVAVIYVVSAWYLNARWKSHGEKVF